jgi:predicted AlkP superfamily pyrophosphatase or phosphodiesterase
MPKASHPGILTSVKEEIDFYLIPNKFNVLESDWILYRSDASYEKQDLIEHLKQYGRTLDDLKNDSKVKYREVDGIVTLEVGKTSHSTDYDYDKKIPLLFYGPKWFTSKVYSKKVDQQSIVPTLTKILQIRNPNGVENIAIPEIFSELKSQEKPELIVTIVIDQGGHQYYRSHPKSFPNIKKLMSNSAYFPNAEVGHLDTHTAVGHAAIGTGAYPRKNMVVGNTFFSMKNNKLFSAEIYAGGDEASVDPSELATETLADVLDNENDDKSEVVSQCYALRASIGMAGHGAFKMKNVSYVGDKDHVYWLDKKSKKWITDSRYYSAPYFLGEYNNFSNYLQHHSGGWRNLDFKTLEEVEKNFHYVLGSPAQVKLEAEMFRRSLEEVIARRDKHKDGFTDLAYVTLKATDSVGHNFGWESLEARDTFQETDRQVGLIVEFLEKHWGDSFILVLTADHGCAPMQEISGGSRYLISDFIKEVNTLLPESIRDQEMIIRKMTVAQISLNHDLIKKYNISEEDIVNKILSIRVEGKPFFKDVVIKKDYENKK